MNKIQADKLMQDEVRAIIPIVDENGKEEYIEVRNPDKKTKEKIFDEILANMEDSDLSLFQNNILKMLLNELTNIELNIDIEDLKNGKISNELETTMYYIGQISNELTNSLLMNFEIKLGQMKNEILQEKVLKEKNEVEKLTNVEEKVVS